MAETQRFSINYKEEDYNIYSADWDGIEKKWKRFVKEYGSWFPEESINEEAYIGILEKFGLLEYEDAFTKERVERTSPDDLGKERRHIEKYLGLDYLEIKSDTMGNHRKVA